MKVYTNGLVRKKVSLDRFVYSVKWSAVGWIYTLALANWKTPFSNAPNYRSCSNGLYSQTQIEMGWNLYWIIDVSPQLMWNRCFVSVAAKYVSLRWNIVMKRCFISVAVKYISPKFLWKTDFHLSYCETDISPPLLWNGCL